VSLESGFNSRLDELQAAVLRLILPELDQQNGRRRALAARYLDALSKSPFGLPPSAAGSVFHQFTVLADDRDGFRAWLESDGIGTDIHYPLGLHRMPAFPRAELPVTDSLTRRVVSLPIQPEIAEPHFERIVGRILEYRKS
jgi:dTDP-4-amino-4,6-dideoxygalactose transaminase